MSEVLEDIIENFPEFLTDEPVNGGDLVEYVGGMIHRYEANRPKPKPRQDSFWWGWLGQFPGEEGSE